MKKHYILFLLTFGINFFVHSQNLLEAEQLVKEGIDLHDKGDYVNAIKKYDLALAADSNNLNALAEKAFSLLSSNKPNEAIKFCLKAIETHPADADLKMVYITLGNSYDAVSNAVRSLETYDAGIKLFPDFYLLYFNKGITYYGMDRMNEALSCFEKSMKLNPFHANSQNAAANILYSKNLKIQSLFAYFRFMILEPVSSKSSTNLEIIKQLMNGNATKTGKQTISISINSDMLKLNDTNADGTNKENNFGQVELLMTIGNSLNFTKSKKKETDVERFIRNFKFLCSTLESEQKKNSGFYWEYYAPFFIELNQRNFSEVFGYLIFVSTGDKKIQKWFKKHNHEVDDFLDWSKRYYYKKSKK